MTTRDIFQRELEGEVIALSTPSIRRLPLITHAQCIIAEMNTGYGDPGEVRALFACEFMDRGGLFIEVLR